MLVMAKQNCPIQLIIKMLDQNEFSECFTHARGRGVCYRSMAVVVKAMNTTSTHNILTVSLLSDV